MFKVDCINLHTVVSNRMMANGMMFSPKGLLGRAGFSRSQETVVCGDVPLRDASSKREIHRFHTK